MKRLYDIEKIERTTIDEIIAAKSRTQALLWLSVALMMLVGLASGLSGVELKSSSNLMAFIFSTASGITAYWIFLLPILALLSIKMAQRLGLFKVIAVFIIMMILFVSFARFFSGRETERVIPENVVKIMEEVRKEKQQKVEESASKQPNESFNYKLSPQTQHVSRWESMLFKGAAAGLLSLLFLFAYLSYRKKQQAMVVAPEKRSLSNEAIVRQVQETLESLQQGKDRRKTIIQCYLKMVETIQQEQNIKRSVSMTSSEFEEKLLAYDLPKEPIKRLTRIFEQVRYGSLQSTSSQLREAETSLEAIIQNCTRSK